MGFCFARRHLSGDTQWDVSPWLQNSGTGQASAADLGIVPPWRATAAVRIDENRVGRDRGERARKNEAWGLSRDQG